MPGYKQPCRYCNELIANDSNHCPYCGRINPVGPLRCHKCRSPIMSGQRACSHCGLSLQINCPKCGKTTFYGDYCENCDTALPADLSQ